MKIRVGIIVAVLLSVPVAAMANSPSDCEAYAKRIEMDSGSIAGGAGRGALRGAAFGAIVGDSSKSARRGAALGGIAGGVRRSVAKSDSYRRAYDNCIAGGVQL